MIEESKKPPQVVKPLCPPGGDYDDDVTAKLHHPIANKSENELAFMMGGGNAASGKSNIYYPNQSYN